MFCTNGYITIKDFTEKKENLWKAKVYSRDKTVQGNYATSFIGEVNFYKNAIKKQPKEGDRIKILSMSVQNCCEIEGELKFFSKPKFSIFDYELISDASQKLESEKVQNKILATDNIDVPF